MATNTTGKLVKIYKIINPESARTTINTSQDTVGDSGLYGNYSWMNKLVQGSSDRLQRYREYDMMDADTDVSMALDIIAQEIIGNNPKTKEPLEIEITAGMEQQIPSRVVVTLKAALKTWCNVHRWNRRLYATVRNTIKYGDFFFFRNKHNNLPFLPCHSKNVTGAIVSKDDVNDIKGWQIRSDHNKAVENVSYSLTATSESYNVQNYTPDEVIRFGLHDDMSDEAPFSQSVLQTIYKTFKQKQMLEDAILIYRIQRAPEKRIFKIELGNTPPHLRAQILETAKMEIKQRKLPSPYGNGDQIDTMYSPISQNEDFFFSMKNGQGSTVETLAGGMQLNQMDDLYWWEAKMWRALRIPQSYMSKNAEGGTPFNDGKVGIAYQQEIKFGLYIESLQVHFEDVLDREFKRFLQDQQINIDPTIFKVVLPEPSNFKKSRQNEIDNALVSLANNATSLESLSQRFIFSKYLQLSKEEIILNERLKREELGLDPNGGKKDLAKIYSPDNADSGGFDGGMTGGDGGGLGSFDDDLGGDTTLSTDNDATNDDTNDTEANDNQQASDDTASNPPATNQKQ